MVDVPTIPLKRRLEGRLQGMRTDRYSWWIHWAELARYILPRRYRWLCTPNQMNRGSAINGAIFDSTGTIAARVLAAGMMSGMTSPTRPWFALRIEGYEKDDISPVSLWLAECRKRMMRVFQESNFYNSIAVVYLDLAVFGTAPMLIDEDFDNVIHCTNPCAGEYYIALNDRLQVDVFYREIVLNPQQMVQWFGLENLSVQTQNLYKQGGASLAQEVVVLQAVEPNAGDDTGVQKQFKYYNIYWEKGAANGPEQFLQRRGYYEFPLICPRWDVTSNDAYGRSPGMDALGDIKQLQQETKRKAQAIDKLANPPMVADVELKNQPASTIPGGVTYLTKKEGAGFKPAYENFRPPVQEMMQDITEIQRRVKSIFFNDLFLMFQELQAEPRSATAIDARREEKLVMLGPVLERFQTEALDPVIDRTFAIMQRAGLFPPPPEEIARSNAPIQVEYESMLATAQRAVGTASIERFLGLVGSSAALRPDVLDIPDWDATLVEYAMMLGNQPKLINSPEIIKFQRDQRQKQQQQAINAELADKAAAAGKTLSETDVGGGVNALQMMTGGLQ